MAEVLVYGTATLSVEDENTNNIKMAPNPVKDVFRITESVGAMVEIYNIEGILLMKKAIESIQEEMDISLFTTGLYFVKVEKDGKLITKKLIKKIIHFYKSIFCNIKII